MDVEELASLILGLLHADGPFDVSYGQGQGMDRLAQKLGVSLHDVDCAIDILVQLRRAAHVSDDNHLLLGVARAA